MAKTFQLTIAERVAAASIFNDFKGSITALSTILDDVKQLVMSDADWALVKGFRKSPTDEEVKVLKEKNPDQNVPQSIFWDDEGSEKDVVFGQASVDYLVNAIKTKSEGAQLTLADKALPTLYKKLTA